MEQQNNDITEMKLMIERIIQQLASQNEVAEKASHNWPLLSQHFFINFH
jgi:hypothetical protein